MVSDSPPCFLIDLFIELFIYDRYGFTVHRCILCYDAVLVPDLAGGGPCPSNLPVMESPIPIEPQFPWRTHLPAPARTCSSGQPHIRIKEFLTTPNPRSPTRVSGGPAGLSLDGRIWPEARVQCWVFVFFPSVWCHSTEMQLDSVVSFRIQF